MNYRKCVSNFPSTWLVKIDNGSFNRPIMARTQILIHRWGPRTSISALFRRRAKPEFSFRLWRRLMATLLTSFHKTIIEVRFNLLQFCSFAPSFLYLPCYLYLLFMFHSVLVAVSNVWILIKFSLINFLCNRESWHQIVWIIKITD